MANDGIVQVPPNSTGGKVDCSSLSVAGQTVVRQRVVIGDPTKSAGLALVSAGALQVAVTGGKIDNISATVLVSGSLTIGGILPGASVTAGSSLTLMGGTDGTLARTILTDSTGKQIVTGQVSVTGSVAIASLNGLGKIDGISAAVALAAGTQHIGEVNISTMPAVNISAMPTVTVTGQVSVTGSVALNAGTQHIGEVNISTMPAVNISAMPHVTIDLISATVIVAGSLSIGGILPGASATAGVSITLVGGTDGTLARTFLTDTSGRQVVNVNGQVSIGGTVTVANPVSLVSITGTVALSSLNGLGKIDGISAAVVLAAGTAHIGEVNISTMPTVTVTGQVSVTGSVAISNNINVSAMPAVSIAAGQTIGINSISATVTVLNSGFFDSSAGSTTLVRVGDSANSAVRVNIVAGGTGGGLVSITGGVVLNAGTAHVGEVNISTMPAVNISAMPTVNVNPLAISGTAVTVASGFYDSSAGSTTTVRVGDSANSAIRANIVAGNLSISGTLDAISATVNVSVTNHITIDQISATVLVAGSLTIGGILNSASITAGSTLTLVGGSDGFVSHILGTDTQGRLIMSGVLNSGSVTVGSQIYLMGGCDGTLARTLATDTGGKLIINNISATVNVAGSFTVGGGQVAGQTVSAANVFTLIGGSDGSLGRIAATDTSGRLIVTITGTVALASLNGLGKIDGISAAVALAAGTAHIGEVNISTMPTVTVTGTGLGISGTVAISNTTFGINSISATVNVAMAAMLAGAASITAASVVVLAGYGGKTSAGAVTVSAQVAWVDQNGREVVILNHPSLAPSASHGPKTVHVSVSNTAVVAVAAPGVSLSIYIDSIIATNGSSSLTSLRLGEFSVSSTANAVFVIDQYLAANGGGFSHQFNPPWRISANQQLSASIKPNASDVKLTVHFHVGP